MATHLQNDEPEKGESRASVCAGESAESADPWLRRVWKVCTVHCKRCLWQFWGPLPTEFGQALREQFMLRPAPTSTTAGKAGWDVAAKVQGWPDITTMIVMFITSHPQPYTEVTWGDCMQTFIRRYQKYCPKQWFCFVAILDNYLILHNTRRMNIIDILIYIIDSDNVLLYIYIYIWRYCFAMSVGWERMPHIIDMIQWNTIQ